MQELSRSRAENHQDEEAIIADALQNWWKDEYVAKIKSVSHDAKVRFLEKNLGKKDKNFSQLNSLLRQSPDLRNEETLALLIKIGGTEYQEADPNGEMSLYQTDLIEDLIRYFNQPLSTNALLLLVQNQKTEIINELLGGEYPKTACPEKFINLNEEILIVILTNSGLLEKNNVTHAPFSTETAKLFFKKFPYIFVATWRFFKAANQDFAEFLVAEKPYIAVQNLSEFSEVSSEKFADLLVRNQHFSLLILHLEKFPTYDLNKLVIAATKKNQLFSIFGSKSSKKIKNLTNQTAEFVALQHSEYLVENLAAFPGITQAQLFEIVKKAGSKGKSKFLEKLSTFKELNTTEVLRFAFTFWETEEIDEFSLGKDSLIQKIPQDVLDLYLQHEKANPKTIWKYLSHFDVQDYSKFTYWLAKRDNTKVIIPFVEKWKFNDKRLQDIQKIFPIIKKLFSDTLLTILISELISNHDHDIATDIANPEQFYSWLLGVINNILNIDDQENVSSLFIGTRVSNQATEFIKKLKRRTSKSLWQKTITYTEEETNKTFLAKPSNFPLEAEVEILTGLKGVPEAKALEKAQAFIKNKEFFLIVREMVRTYHIFNLSEPKLYAALQCCQKIVEFAEGLEEKITETNVKSYLKKLSDEVPYWKPDTEFFIIALEKIKDLEHQKIIGIGDSIEEFSTRFLVPLILLKSGKINQGKPAIEALTKSPELKKAGINFLLFNHSPQATKLGLPLTFSDLMGLSQEWHRTDRKIPESIIDLKIGTEWQPLFSNTEELTYNINNDVFLVKCLTTSLQLEQEGKNLKHCVGNGGYARKCGQAEAHILSIRRQTPHGWEPLSTAEIRVDHNKNLSVRQHYGYDDSKPNRAEVEVLELFLTDVKNKKIILNKEFGEVARSKHQTTKLAQFEHIGFIPTPEKLKSVIEYYLNLTWQPQNELRHKELRSIFAPSGSITRLNEQGFRYMTQLFRGIDQQQASTVAEAIHDFGPLLDVILDPLVKEFFHKRTSISTSELLSST